MPRKDIKPNAKQKRKKKEKTPIDIMREKENIRKSLLDLDPNMSKDMQDDLVEMLYQASAKGKPKRNMRWYFNELLKEMFSFFIIYVSTTVIFGFFSLDLIIDNIFMLFLVSLVISTTFFLYKHIYFKMRGRIMLFIIKKFIVLALIMTLFALINATVFKVFSTTSSCVFYLIFGYVLSEIIEYIISDYI